MTSRAHVRSDWVRAQVGIAVLHERGSIREVIQWPTTVDVRTFEHGEGTGEEGLETDWLYIPEDDARAIYEALADHFGHTGHDIRALRKDYEAERARVDKFIAQAVARQP